MAINNRKFRLLPLAAALALGVFCAPGNPEKSEPAPAPEIPDASANITDRRDGQKYRTVKIGKNIWMAENLRYNAGNSRCYDNDESKCREYGRLYDENTAMGACPAGWHIAIPSEWHELKRGELERAIIRPGNALKAKSGWNDGGNGTDDYGFSALPGGARNSDGVFYNAGYGGNWWAWADLGYESEPNFFRINYHSGSVDNGRYYSGYGFSVRCVMDAAY